MRIERIELHHISMRLKNSFITSFGEELDRECLLVRVYSEGLDGWGECVASREPGFSYETVETAWHVLRDFFIPAILNRPVSHPRELKQHLQAYKGHPLARAGLELALWDLRGKLDGKCLRALLGGEKHSVAVGVSVGIQENPEAMIEKVGEYLHNGYGRIKIKIKPGADLDVVRAVRDSYPDINLQVDANAAYALSDAPLFKDLDSLGLSMIEQPFAEDDLIDHAELQAQINTPICLDESIRNHRHAGQAIAIKACEVINIKSGRVGGLTEAIAIHDRCVGERVPVWCGGMLETGIGRAANLALASLPGFTLPGDISASDRYYDPDIAEPRFTLNSDSTIDVPDKPGLGVDVIQEELERVTLKVEVLT
ncbi:MAG: o-succinylbenzoate synthase [Anaerolineales bacterium]|nr:MAG: o-succinylbenzoate synthase [Anaerolineales bacterium]